MTRDEVISVSAAMMRCGLMFQLWEKNKIGILKAYPSFGDQTIEPDPNFMNHPSVSYLILGTALLFVVIEFLHDHLVCFPDSIRQDIVDLYPKLKEFRNCVFHTQGQLISARQAALLQHPGALDKLQRIHSALNDLIVSLGKEYSIIFSSTSI